MVAVAWLGEAVHDAISVPAATLTSLETIGPGALSMALVLACARRAGSRAALACLLGWAGLNFVGGAILSVLPLGILGFLPDQTGRHYVAQVVYRAAQVPLIGLTWRALRAPIDGA